MFLDIMYRIATIFIFTILPGQLIFAQCPKNFDVAVDNMEADCGEIVYAGVIFRHGERNPYITYPTDPYKSYSWPYGGLGQLTDFGKQMEFELGKYLYKRYSKLTGSTYDRTNFIMNSTDVDRTLMSGQCCLAGYFAPPDVCYWSDDVNWSPIPIHSTPRSMDKTLAMGEKCPLYDQSATQYYENDPFIASLCDRYADVFSYCQNYSELVLTPCRSGATFRNLGYLYDTLYVEKEQYNFTIPAWTDEIYPHPLTFIFNATFSIEINDFEIKRLKAGLLLKDLLDEMQAKIDSIEQNTQDTISLHLYSAHDRTLAVLMFTLEVYSGYFIPYGSSLSFELRHYNGQYCVSLFYQNTTSHAPYLLEMPRCPHPCSYENFVKMLKPIIPDDWYAECYSDISEIPKEQESIDEKPTWNYWIDSNSWFDPVNWRQSVEKYWPLEKFRHVPNIPKMWTPKIPVMRPPLIFG